MVHFLTKATKALDEMPIVLRSSVSCTNLIRVFRLQNRAICVIAGVNKRTSCKHFLKVFQILTLPSLYKYEIVMFYKFKSPPIKTGRDLQTYNTIQLQQHRQTSHRLEFAAALTLKIFNKLSAPEKSTRSEVFLTS